MKHIQFLISLIIVFSSCNYNKKDQINSLSSNNNFVIDTIGNYYKIFNNESHGTGQITKIKYYVYLTIDTESKDDLKVILNHIYNKLQNDNNNTTSSAIGIYLYTSENKAQNSQDQWIAMLNKPTFGNAEITFSFLLDITPEDEKIYNWLVDYLNKRNTDLCVILKQLEELETNSIKKADLKYPDYGPEYLKYQSSEYKKEKKKLFDKYNIHDSLSTRIVIFGMAYCK